MVAALRSRLTLAATAGAALVVPLLLAASTGPVASLASMPSRLAEASIPDAGWERRWITPIDPNVCTTEPGQSTRFNDPRVEHAFHVDGGRLELTLDIGTGRAVGHWTLDGVKAPWGWLHLLPPAGFRLDAARANDTPVAVDGDDDDRHLPIPLDACGREACEIDLHFTWQAPAPGGWARARDLLPRLGLDGDRLLRSARQRVASGLQVSPTLPEYAAATVVAGVAPAGAWQWSIRLVTTDDEVARPDPAGVTGPSGTDSGLARSGRIDGPEIVDRYDGRTLGPLDFSVAWPAPTANGVVQTAEADTRIIEADLSAMQACVADRTGLASASTVLRWRLALTASEAHLAEGVLSLAPALIADRPARLDATARAIALRSIADAGRLRETRAGQWLARALPGAIALLCATGALDGEDAAGLLQRVSDRATAAMALAGDEVGAVAWSRYHGWVADYAPLSALDTVRRLTPAEIRTMVEAAGNGTRPAYAMASTLGAGRAALVLGMPLATDLVATGDTVSSTRWRWQQGQWKPLGQHAPHWPLPTLDAGTAGEATAGIDSADAPILLDAWPAYERHFADNRPRPDPFATAQRPAPSDSRLTPR